MRSCPDTDIDPFYFIIRYFFIINNNGTLKTEVITVKLDCLCQALLIFPQFKILNKYSLINVMYKNNIDKYC